jgi:hypothetical protein
MRRLNVVFLVLLSFTTPASVHAAAISPAGKELSRFLDGLDVESLWLSGQRVDWKTGQSTGPSAPTSTHCSAFVAAACLQRGIYILRPPDHSAVLLANAQYDWLRSEGSEHGWKQVGSKAKAQKLANEGLLVVAAYKNPDPKKPGHIAIVRPSVKGLRTIAREGPQIIQAGRTNWNSATLKEGFKRHPDAWRDRHILFFAHGLEGKK